MKRLILAYASLVLSQSLVATAQDFLDPCLQDAFMVKANAERGQKAYMVCRGCHKADGSGRPEAGYPQLAGQHSQVLIKQMTDVRCGKRDNSRMHPFIEAEAVPTEDIPDIAAYLASLPVPDKNLKGPGNKLIRGQSLYDKDCSVCHGNKGEGDGRRFYPMVAGQHYPYLLRETMDIHDKTRRNANPDMVKVLRHYTDEDIAAVSDYMSHLPPAGR